jgi:hypothetical protein
MRRDFPLPYASVGRASIGFPALREGREFRTSPTCHTAWLNGQWRRAIVWLCVGWFSSCPYFEPRSNALPLAFGMSPQEAQAALNVPLVPVPGRKGSVYFTTRPSSIPGFFPYENQLWLQFRGGRLTGWTKDWQHPAWWW